MDHSECFEVQNSKKKPWGGGGITTPPDPPAAITLAITSRVWLATLVCSANFQAHRQTSVFIHVRFPDGKYLQAEEAAPAGCKHFCRPLTGHLIYSTNLPPPPSFKHYPKRMMFKFQDRSFRTISIVYCWYST